MPPLNTEKGSSKHSAYDLRDPHADRLESHTLAIIFDNESGVLARVIGLFSARRRDALAFASGHVCSACAI